MTGGLRASRGVTPRRRSVARCGRTEPPFAPKLPRLILVYARGAASRWCGDVEIAKSGEIPELSRNGDAPFGDEPGRLLCVDVIGPRRKDGSFHFSEVVTGFNRPPF